MNLLQRKIRMYRATLLFVIFFGISANTLANMSDNSDEATLEYKIKATYIFNFLKYIEWPSETAVSRRSFVIGILGENRFGDALSFFSGKTVKDRIIEIREFGNINEIEDCHILFVSSSADKTVNRILEEVQGKQILTIGETDSFIEKGGAIEFVVDKGKVSFIVNLNIARKEGLIVSSKLLRVAKNVKRK